MTTVVEVLAQVQAELKAPKGQYNSFGKYNYRSTEDILEGLKPVLAKHKASVVLSDDVELVGDRYYIVATATFYHGTETISNKAMARESLTKKGMDDSQITGTASSYARKYALNGLFLIDDTKDADTDEYKKQTSPKEQSSKKPQSKPTKISEAKVLSYQNAIDVIIRKTGKSDGSIMRWFCEHLGVIRIEDITEEQVPIADGLITKMQNKKTEGA